MFPAFKEWQIIVDALGAGEQLIILRKGGIAEGRGGFDAARADRFWLFPTHFHAQREKTKPAASFAPSVAADSGTVTLRYFADIVRHRFLNNWSAVAALDSHHLWTEAAVREKFEWSSPPGLHVFILRVHRIDTPVTLPLTTEMRGCKSWIDLPAPFPSAATQPVIEDDHFKTGLNRLGPLIH